MERRNSGLRSAIFTNGDAPRHRRRLAAAVVRVEKVSDETCGLPLPTTTRRHLYKSRTVGRRSCFLWFYFISAPVDLKKQDALV